ncbi:HPr kinase/phosphorylase [Aquibium microcysteis]|uniref:HPr kinase/phosphorylase n=1 Tax=Aquibium microcysteis TaxID=675281 RepID=UPI00165CEF56|nr:HPr kinase/phosphorylase [Aquibium microcysteis]
MRNIHATGVILGDRGVLLTGRSGSGKTTLALELLARADAAGGFARLVCDDQVLVEARGGRLLARAAPAIAGLVEVAGLGPSVVASEPAMTVDLVVRLVPAGEAPRISAGEAVSIEGVSLARLDLPERGADAAAHAVLAWMAPGRHAHATTGAAK